jgi:hypothetical protein
MPDYIADSEGHIDVPGVTATYPPGTIVTYINGAYAGHVSPVVEANVDGLIMQGNTSSGGTFSAAMTGTPLQGGSMEPIEHPEDTQIG